ncbi:MAG: LAGLIDADG family homing endonuclease, partial [Arcobacter sp.]
MAGSSIVVTEKGLIPIKDLTETPAEGTATSFSTTVATHKGNFQVSGFYYGGIKETIKVTTNAGFRIEGTKVHPVLVASEQGPIWKKLKDITPDDYIAVVRGTDMWGNNTNLSFTLSKFANQAIRYTMPTTLTEDIAYVAGLLVGDGSMSIDGHYSLSNPEPEIQSEFIRIHKEVFGYEANVKQWEDKCPCIEVRSVYIQDFWRKFGISGTAACKTIPRTILTAPRPIVVAFLQGLFDTDGSALSNGYIEYCSKSQILVTQVQIVLANLGIIGHLRTKNVNGETYYCLSLYGNEARKFYELVGFRLYRKQIRRNKLPKVSNPNVDVVPYGQVLLKQLWKEFLPQPEKIHKAVGKKIVTPRAPSRERIARALEKLNPSPSKTLTALQELANPLIFWDKVKFIEYGIAEVYDLHVPGQHSFVANGIAVH